MESSCGGIMSTCRQQAKPDVTPLRDLTGQTFNELTVLRRAANRGAAVYWRCRCSCGTEVEVSRRNLTSGQKASCGHLSRAEDLTGQTLGEWLVLAPEAPTVLSGAWLCRCSCGVERAVWANNLKAGSSRSCGHYVPKSTTRMTIDISEWSVVLVCPVCPWRWLLIGAEPEEIRSMTRSHVLRHKNEQIEYAAELAALERMGGE